jgi:hypothetical protein
VHHKKLTPSALIALPKKVGIVQPVTLKLPFLNAAEYIISVVRYGDWAQLKPTVALLGMT